MLKKNTAFIRVLELKVLKTFILDTLAGENTVKPMVFDVLGSLEPPGPPWGSLGLWIESNQWIESMNRTNEPTNRINESNQRIESMNRNKESNQRIESKSRIKESNQRIDSKNRINESKQRIETHRDTERHTETSNQRIESMNRKQVTF